MGLMSFSLVMIGLDLALVTDAEYVALGVRLRRGWEGLKKRLLNSAEVPSS
jgi:hypothetical protein